MMSWSPLGEYGYTVCGRPNSTGLCRPPGVFTCSLGLPPLGQQGWPDRMFWPLSHAAKNVEAGNFGSELDGGFGKFGSELCGGRQVRIRTFRCHKRRCLVFRGPPSSDPACSDPNFQGPESSDPNFLGEDARRSKHPHH
jgi:hypothetical protein